MAEPQEPLQWQHLRGPDIAALDRARTIVWVPVSPIEVHGPHLPTVTDNLEARGLTRAVIGHLAERHPEMVHVEVPPIWVAADVLPHTGSLAFRSTTVSRVLEDLGRSLAKQGFRHVWMTSFHGGPRHFVPMEVAAARVNRRYRRLGAGMLSVFSLMLTRLTGGASDLSDVLSPIPGIAKADLVGDSHGGAIETSIMLHLLGEHVDARYRELPRRTVNDRLAEQGKPPLPTSKPSMRDIFRSFGAKLAYYRAETYAGDPALGRAEVGAQVLDELGAFTADALSDVWTGKLSPAAARSPLWKLRWLFMEPRVGALFERLMGLPSRVW